MQGFLPIPALEAPSDGWAFLFSAAKGRPGWAALTGGTLTGFTAGLVAFGSSAGGLTTDANFSYNIGTGALNVGGNGTFGGTLLTITQASADIGILANNTSSTFGSYITAQSGNGTTSGRYAAIRCIANETSGRTWYCGMVGSQTFQILDQTAGITAIGITAGTGAIALGGATSCTSSIKSTSATAGIGYATGAGGTVTQATSKSTGVTLNTVCGTITLNAASLAANTSVAFTWTNSAIAATDYVDIQHDSVGTLGAYAVCVTPAAGSATVTVRNNTAGALAEAIVLRFFVTKAVTS